MTIMASATKQSNAAAAIECRSTQEHVGEHTDEMILPVAISLMGTLVKVQTKENKTFEGIFRAFSPQFEIALEIAHQLIPGREEDLPVRSKIHDKIIFKLQDVVKIEGTPDLDSVVKAGFATDTEISGVANNGSFDNLRDLEPWEPDESDDLHFSPGNNGPLPDGWSVDEMLSVNEKRFAIKSDYDERLYSTAEVSLDLTNAEDQEKERKAIEIAREIERNPASKRAAELENEDEERDIVVKSSGSSANNSTATTPTSTTASGVPGRGDKYIYSTNKRNSGGGGAGGDRGGRGGGGGGGRRGGGGTYYPPSLRHQGSGEMRPPPRLPSGRDYGNGGGGGAYSVGGGNTYYGQRAGGRYNQQQQPHHHHQMGMAPSSHERSPTGPGASSNEWIRTGPKRHDNMRGEPYPSGPQQQQQHSLPPQGSMPPGPGGRQMPPPTSSMPPRHSADGPGGANAGRRSHHRLEDLKKFGNDFQLAPESMSGGGVPNQGQGQGQGPSRANAPSAGPGGVGGGSSRMHPPQPSPNQTQMPPPAPPSNVQQPPPSHPPPHHQQRRSPDLKNQPGHGYGGPGHQAPPSGPPPPSHAPHQPKQLPQASPGQQAQQAQQQQLPPSMVRTDLPPRLMAGGGGGGEPIYHPHPHPQQQQMQQHPQGDYGGGAGSHPRPMHPAMMGMPPGAQAGAGGPPLQGPKMQQQMPSGHGPPPQQQVQPMVTTQPPPPGSMAQQPPPPAHTPQQQGQTQQLQQGDHEQRSGESSSESIKKSKLNPDAAEFHPQFFRQGAASTGAPPVMQNPAIMGGYPVPVQSPPQQQQQASSVVPVGPNSGAGAIYGGVQMQPAGNQPGAFMSGAAYQPQQQVHSSSMPVHIIPGSTTVYTMQGNPQQQMTLVPNNNAAAYRPRAAVGAPQPAVVAATGQPIMANPYNHPAGQLVYYNANMHQTTAAPLTAAQAGGAYQPTYVINTHRMFAPQYVMPQAPANGDQQQQPQQQQYYALSPAVPMGVGSYPQAASVPAISVAPGMQQQQSAPQAMYAHHQHQQQQQHLHQQQQQQQHQHQQHQGNGNNSQSQTPPSSQQQMPPPAPPNSSSAAAASGSAGQQHGPPTQQPPPSAPTPAGSSNSSANNNASGTGPTSGGGVVTAYPPSAPTPQSPHQYPTTVPVVTPYPGAQPLFLVQTPGGYVAGTAAGGNPPQMYSNQAVLPPGAVHIHGPGAAHHGYQSAAHAHFASPEYAHQYAAVAAAQQAAFAAAAQQHAASSGGYPPSVLRSSSVPAFVPAGPPVNVPGAGASGQGVAPISHQSNHA